VGKPLLYVNDAIPDDEAVARWSAGISRHTGRPVKLY